MNKNEAASRVIVDAMLAAQGWNTTYPNAVHFEVVMPGSARADYVPSAGPVSWKWSEITNAIGQTNGVLMGRSFKFYRVHFRSP